MISLAIQNKSDYHKSMDNQTDQNKVVILHGFTREQIHTVMKAVRNEIEHGETIAFAKTTEHSLKRTLGDLVGDISQEHDYMRKHPPQIKQTPQE